MRSMPSSATAATCSGIAAQGLLTWCGPSGTTRSAAEGDIAVRNASPARAKGWRAGAGPRGSTSGRGPADWPAARAAGVMSSQTRAAISERRNPAQNASATIAASRRPRAAAAAGVSRPRPRRWGRGAARISSIAVA